jgi:hypothetical protein
MTLAPPTAQPSAQRRTGFFGAVFATMSRPLLSGRTLAAWRGG